jgi:hypothetical protein
MKHRWAALVLVLALGVFMPRVMAAQTGSGQIPSKLSRPGMTLGQNYPNPFNPETWIPFTVGMDAGDPPTCADLGRQHKVTLRVYNVLAQVVAIPVLQGGSSGVAGGQPIENLMLTCSQYKAYWDGKVLNTGREAASGVYIVKLEVDGKVLVSRVLVSK